VDQPFFESYLGIRVEPVDMTEFVRRIEREIYDPEEYARALAWVRENCTEGRDHNLPDMQRSRAQEGLRSCPQRLCGSRSKAWPVSACRRRALPP